MSSTEVVEQEVHRPLGREVAIVGYGIVGKSMAKLFPDAVIHDPPLGMDRSEAVNYSRVAFVCVPTLTGSEIVERVVGEIQSQVICIRSTVPPGTTERLRRETGKAIVYQPEFISPLSNHPYHDPRNVRWAVLGGSQENCAAVARQYQKVQPELTFYFTDPTTAELTKHMTNAFLSMKVGFCNEFYDLAQLHGVDYEELRTMWLADPRMNPHHTLIDPEDRSFGGPCLPKDLRMLLAHSPDGLLPVLRALQARNDALREAT